MFVRTLFSLTRERGFQVYLASVISKFVHNTMF
jgi:hypothetical protein